MAAVALMPMRIVRVVMSFMVAAGLVGGLVRHWNFATPWKTYEFVCSWYWIRMSGWTYWSEKCI